MIGPKSETVIQYRQTFTFRPRRITVDGDLTWVYGHETRPAEICVLNYFAPYSVRWPIRMAGAEGAMKELALAWSGGAPFPAGLTHPATAEIWFRGGGRSWCAANGSRRTGNPARA